MSCPQTFLLRQPALPHFRPSTMRSKLVSEINVARPPVSAGCETVTLTGHLLGYARVSTVDEQPRL